MLETSMAQVHLCSELVIVCCHAIYNIHTQDPLEEANWHLKDFQKGNSFTGKPSEHLTFVSHIQAAIEALRSRPETFVVFSGGATDASIPYSEAESYERAFMDLHLVAYKNEHTLEYVKDQRWSVETYSTDSFQNLLFSILEFRRQIGTYPEKITVITHAFKADRFLKLHAPAIRWPLHRIRVQGIDPSFTIAELEVVRMAERRNATALFEQTPFGDRGVLLEKREQRGWKAQTADKLAQGQNGSVAALLQRTGNQIAAVSLKLPWED